MPPKASPSRALLLAGIAGAVVLVAALFLPWFEATLTGVPNREQVLDLARQGGADLSLTGWESYDVLDLAVAACAIVGLAALLTGRQPWLAPAAGAAAAVLVLTAIVDPPGVSDAVDAEPGIWLALAGALTLAVAGALRVIRQ